MNRRQFLKTSAGAAALLAMQRRAYAFSQSMPLQKFIQPLRGVSLPPYTSPGIPVALPDVMSVLPGVNPNLPNGLDHYSIVAGQYTDQLHPSLPATKLWGYADGANGSVHRHLGGVIVATRGKPVQATFTNNLPTTHILPVDTTLPGANQAQNRIAVHLHGGFIPWISDGGPHDWFDPQGNHGLSFLNNSATYPTGPSWGLNQAEYFWSMDLSARMLWYHDHAWGTTRLNAYAGVATALLIRDPLGLEGQLLAQGLPGYVEAGGREVPLVIQDKIFKNNAGPKAAKFAQYETPVGDLWYPYIYENTRWKTGINSLGLPIASCIPEFFGDTMLMNGTVYPTLTVEPRRYRFRILNACNARFVNLQLFVQDASVDGITLNAKTLLPTNPVGPAITQIGAEGGFLPAPVTLNVGTAAALAFNPVTMTGNLLMAPAERADVVIDFSGLEGTKLILYNDAPAPFPIGDPRNDYFPGAPNNATVTTPGFGPNTRQLMQFVVGTTTAAPDPPLNLAGLAMDPGPIVPSGAGVINGVVQLPPGVPVRQLTLNEQFDAYGRLIQTIGTNVLAPPDPNIVKGTYGRAYMGTPTEVIARGTTEIWAIANLTGDTHPIHIHLINAQIIARQPFRVNQYAGTAVFTAPARLPEPNEMGWKETVRMNPGEVTWVIAKFDLPAVPFDVPTSPRTSGCEYVYHCHILEHEEHDMMRPLVVT